METGQVRNRDYPHLSAASNLVTVHGYLLGLDYDQCKKVAHHLWNTNRVLQPRAQGMHRHAQPENSIWVDIFPTQASKNEAVKKAWDGYRFMLHMVENVDTEATEVFKT